MGLLGKVLIEHWPRLLLYIRSLSSSASQSHGTKQVPYPPSSIPGQFVRGPGASSTDCLGSCPRTEALDYHILKRDPSTRELKVALRAMFWVPGCPYLSPVSRTVRA